MNASPRYARLAGIALVGGLFLSSASPLAARTLLMNICRVKGQEENSLQGLGLVVGLKGTGDGGNVHTISSLLTAMELMGSPTPISQKGPLELKDAKNVALVMVTATVPRGGARQGDQLDCVVSSIGGAKSLAGGQLFFTPLVGPQVGNDRVYAFAQGPIHLDDSKITTTGRIAAGCRLEEDFFNVFSKDGKITLVLDKNHAGFQVAQDVADLVNNQLSFQSKDGNVARAVDQVNIEVLIPPKYKDDPVAWVSQIVNLPLLEPQTDARVVINQRAGSIVIGGDVDIGAVVVTHKNWIIETTPGAPQVDRFAPLETSVTPSPKLKNLLTALEALKVPPEDVIEIIKGLDRNGKLHATLVIE